MKRLMLLSLFSLLFSFVWSQGNLKEIKKVAKLMGCRFELTAVSSSDTLAWFAIEKGIEEIDRIEKLISSWNPDSQTSEINRNAGFRPVLVDKELYDLIYRAKKISQLTGGAFDISFASMDNIWDFNRLEQSLPDSLFIVKAAAKINWQNIILDPVRHSVFLKENGMKIGFGAIGKGYAANRALEVIRNIEGISGGLVNASGDLTAWGLNTKGENWTIQIANPVDKEKMIGWLSMQEMAIVTSGDYEKYFMSEGKRYAHIINPTTGWPTTGITSVTIVCPDTEIADALATSVFVLGKEKGLELINQLNGIECLIIDDTGDMLSSAGLKLNYY
jgi:thiamine biosynthesis lipoprotein